jgi:hypothetical protein
VSKFRSSGRYGDEFFHCDAYYLWALCMHLASCQSQRLEFWGDPDIFGKFLHRRGNCTIRRVTERNRCELRLKLLVFICNRYAVLLWDIFVRCEGLCFVFNFVSTWQVARPSYKENRKEISLWILMKTRKRKMQKARSKLHNRRVYRTVGCYRQSSRAKERTPGVLTRCIQRIDGWRYQWYRLSQE